MKKVSLVFVALILELLVFQNAHSESFKGLEWVDPSTFRLVLWRIHTQPLDSNSYMHVTVDSVLKDDFYAKEKYEIAKGYEKLYANTLKPNNYYLLLAIAKCNEEIASEGKCVLAIPKEDCLDGKNKGDCILPDTPKNRKHLIKRWTENKSEKFIRERKGGDID